MTFRCGSSGCKLFESICAFKLLVAVSGDGRFTPATELFGIPIIGAGKMMKEKGRSLV